MLFPTGSGISKHIESTAATHRYIKWNVYQLSPPQNREEFPGQFTLHNAGLAGLPERETKHTKKITLEGAVKTFVQTARFVTSLIAHVTRTEHVRWVRRLTMRSRRHARQGHATLIQVRNHRNLEASRTEDKFTFFFGVFGNSPPQQPQK